MFTYHPAIVLELTADGVQSYLVSRGLVPDGLPVRVEELAGGVSCEVLRVFPAGAEPIVVKQALPKLRVSADWFSDPARIEREVIVMGLARGALGERHVPAVLDYDPENFIYCMTSAPLDARNWKHDLLASKLDEKLAAQCGSLLALFHQITPTGRDAELLQDKTYFCQLRIEAYLEYSAEKAPEVAGELLNLAAELKSAKLCLTHADYTPKNFLVSDDDLILLDYEVSHIGHGVFDVASILNHFYLKGIRNPADRSGFEALSRAFLDEYRRRNGMASDDAILWRCLGGLMLARVVGKSPVEYLDSEGKLAARSRAVRLLTGEIRHLGELY